MLLQVLHVLHACSIVWLQEYRVRYVRCTYIRMYWHCVSSKQYSYIACLILLDPIPKSSSSSVILSPSHSLASPFASLACNSQTYGHQGAHCSKVVKFHILFSLFTVLSQMQTLYLSNPQKGGNALLRAPRSKLVVAKDQRLATLGLSRVTK